MERYEASRWDAFTFQTKSSNACYSLFELRKRPPNLPRGSNAQNEGQHAILNATQNETPRNPGPKINRKWFKNEDGIRPQNGDGIRPQNGDGIRPQNGDGTRPQNGDGIRTKNGDAFPECERARILATCRTPKGPWLQLVRGGVPSPFWVRILTPFWVRIPSPFWARIPSSFSLYVWPQGLATSYFEPHFGLCDGPHFGHWSYATNYVVFAWARRANSMLCWIEIETQMHPNLMLHSVPRGGSTSDRERPSYNF